MFHNFFFPLFRLVMFKRDIRYFDWDGQVHIVKGKTGGQQGDPLEMLIFNLTVHHIWGRVLAKFQGARVFVYTDDGYIKGKLSDVLEVLGELKSVLKEDEVWSLIFPRLLFFLRLLLSRRSSMCHMHSLITPPNLLSLVGSFPLTQFVAKKCRDIIEDVEKLDAIEDSFIHFQFLRFCQGTRLQYINSHILLDNRCVLQQQHVDVKIADALLKKGTKQHADGWDAAAKDWEHMVIHLPHAEGGFGVPFNCVTKDAAF